MELMPQTNASQRNVSNLWRLHDDYYNNSVVQKSGTIQFYADSVNLTEKNCTIYT